MQYLVWADFKGLISTYSVNPVYVSLPSGYQLAVNMDTFSFLCVLPKDGLTDQLDFEGNYKDSLINPDICAPASDDNMKDIKLELEMIKQILGIATGINSDDFLK